MNKLKMSEDFSEELIRECIIRIAEDFNRSLKSKEDSYILKTSDYDNISEIDIENPAAKELVFISMYHTFRFLLGEMGLLTLDDSEHELEITLKRRDSKDRVMLLELSDLLDVFREKMKDCDFSSLSYPNPHIFSEYR